MFIAFHLEGLASTVAAQGQPEWATQLWGAAQRLRQTTEMVMPPLLAMPPLMRLTYEHLVTNLQAQLGEEAFTALWNQGRTMTLEQTLAAEGAATIPTPVPIEQPSTRPVKPSSTYPDGLTAREVEVLRLVAQGLKNEQVAQRLIISPRTVDTHLTSIYSKIGVSSRSAATRYAIEHHLV